MSPRPSPGAETVSLSDPHRAQLEGLARARSTPQARAFRCRLILRAAAEDRPSHLRIAAASRRARHTVATWRHRYLDQGLPGLQGAPRSGRPRGSPPSQRLDGISSARRTPDPQDCPATRRALDDLATALSNRAAHDLAMSRSTIWRTPDQADLKPHRSADWPTSHDPDGDAQARATCELYLEAPARDRRGRLVSGCDEKTGMPAPGRPPPTQPARPGRPARREPDYIRHGTRASIGSFVAATGGVIGDPGPTRTSADSAAPRRHVAGRRPGTSGCDRIVANLNTPRSLDVCRLMAELCAVPSVAAGSGTGRPRRGFLTGPTRKHVSHFLPTHGSWLNRVELGFSVFTRRSLKRGDFAAMADLAARLPEFLADDNRSHAHRYRWTDDGTPLVRGMPFGRTRRDQRQGRAWCSPRPRRFQRDLDPPRPYRRRLKPTG